MELEGNWGAVKRYITQVLQARGLDGVQAERTGHSPGMDEIFGLVRMKRHYDEGEFDVLIIDSAPTGTALRLLSLPEWGVVYAPLLQAVPGNFGSAAAAGGADFPPDRWLLSAR
jgi:arsenite-transporting ATPase